MSEKIGIVGTGNVGNLICDMIPNSIYIDHGVYVYDKYKHDDETDTKEDINKCDYVFICVPTDLNPKTNMLDTSNVEEVFNWCTVKNICIKSTVPVGFTDVLQSIIYRDKNIVFSPEYYGETICHPYAESGADWVTLGGTPEATKIFADLIQKWYPCTTKIHCTDSKTAELAKFMENAFLATKVTFCNTFYDLAQAFGVDYHKLRETWLLDPRIGNSHTMVYPDNRGYGGKCLPKDIQSIATQAMISREMNMDFLNSVIKTNKRIRGEE